MLASASSDTLIPGIENKLNVSILDRSEYKSLSESVVVYDYEVTDSESVSRLLLCSPWIESLVESESTESFLPIRKTDSCSTDPPFRTEYVYFD